MFEKKRILEHLLFTFIYSQAEKKIIILVVHSYDLMGWYKVLARYQLTDRKTMRVNFLVFFHLHANMLNVIE